MIHYSITALMTNTFKRKETGVYKTIYFPDPKVLEELDERCRNTKRSRYSAIYDLLQRNKYWENLTARTLEDKRTPMGVF